jgi:hypothetical protein
VRRCWSCNGHGLRNEDEPNCYRPGNLCKWTNDICQEADDSGKFMCACESKIVVCKKCGGRGMILSPLEELAEVAE